MAIDNKYGRVTLEKGTIGEDEPVVVFRARDKTLPRVLFYYGLLCGQEGSSDHHLRLIRETKEKIDRWQEQNPPRVPNSHTHQMELFPEG